MLKTLQNGRILAEVPTPRTSKCLIMNVRPQARIYLTPIQKPLLVQPIVKEAGPSATISCNQCQCEMSVHDLRNHIRVCKTQANYVYIIV